MRLNINNNEVFVYDNKHKVGTPINKRIFNEEKFEYRVINREDFIDELINWISECTQDRRRDKQLMKDDLKYLMSVKDEFIFSSIYTNEYVVASDNNYDEVCENLLELNSFVNEVEEYMELHNNDEAGINNQWNYEDAEYHLLLSDRYYYKRLKTTKL